MLERESHRGEQNTVALHTGFPHAALTAAQVRDNCHGRGTPLAQPMLSHPTHLQMPTDLKVCCSHSPAPTEGEHLTQQRRCLSHQEGKDRKAHPLCSNKVQELLKPYVGLCYTPSTPFTLVTFKGQTKNQKQHWAIFIQDSMTKITAISAI